jgi:hypothetical protein
LHAEFVLVLIICANKYAYKPFEEIVRIIKSSLKNKVADYKLDCYISHRNAEQTMLSLDDTEDSNLEECLGIEMSDFDMSYFLSLLSDDGKLLVDAATNPEKYNMVVFHMNLAIARKNTTSPKNGWNITMTPIVLQRGLGWDKLKLSKVWSEVTQALATC